MQNICWKPPEYLWLIKIYLWEVTIQVFSFLSVQRLLSNEEEKNKEIIQEICFMVSFNICDDLKPSESFLYAVNVMRKSS